MLSSTQQVTLETSNGQLDAEEGRVGNGVTLLTCTYLVYGVLKSFLLRVGLGQRVGMMLCKFHSPVSLPLESRFKYKHTNCSKQHQHNCCHDNRE